MNVFSDSNNWVTEIHQDDGSAFSLRNAEKLYEEQTDYQRIEFYRTEAYGHVLLLDGFMQLTQRENFIYHEMMVHPALFIHKQPKRVVIIGGGDCGSLQAVLRHPEVEQVRQIEIDRRVTELSERYFPELCTENSDQRAHLLFEDGITWLENQEPGSLDVIIVDSTDPVGISEGLFNLDFHRSCWQALGEGGVFVQQSESPLYHQALIVALHQSLGAVGFQSRGVLSFPQPCYPSGWWSCSLARKEASVFEFRERDSQNRVFETRYYTPSIHRAAYAQPAFLESVLA